MPTVYTPPNDNNNRLLRNEYGGTYLNPGYTAPTTNAISNQYATYNQGVKQNAQNFDEIMQGYRNILAMPSASSGGFQSVMPAQTGTPTQYNATQYQPSTTARYIPVNTNLNLAQYNPQQYRYQEDPNVASSISNLRELSNTGGYSEADKSNLRERGISPIRSVYANAQRNIDRSRSLQGGYSPNYAAVTAKSAREMADMVSSKTTDVNAGIAQNVAQNRLAISPALASATAAQQSERNKYGLQNTQFANDALKYNADAMNNISFANINALNDANKFNIGESNRIGLANADATNTMNRTNAESINTNNANNAERVNAANMYNSQTPLQMRLQGNQQDIQRQLEALRGMQGLYGTTPALAQLFGNQALNGAQFQNLVNQQNRSGALGIVSGAMR